MTARALPGASARRERLARERTASQLRRRARLEAAPRARVEGGPIPCPAS